METMTGKTTAKTPTVAMADQQITGGRLLARALKNKGVDVIFSLIGTGCAVVAAGPGSTDPITGVANAWYEESAMDVAKAKVEP